MYAILGFIYYRKDMLYSYLKKQELFI